MNIVDDYLIRHNIDIPIVYHTKNAYVFCKAGCVGKTFWKVINIQYFRENYHPSYYLFKVFRPKRWDRFFEQMKLNSLYWDDYESYLINWAQSVSKENVCTNVMAKATLWEIFVSCLGNQLSHCANDDLFFSTIDTEIDWQERETNIDIFVHKLRNHNHLVRTWHEVSHDILSNYSEWLVKLVQYYGK